VARPEPLPHGEAEREQARRAEHAQPHHLRRGRERAAERGEDEEADGLARRRPPRADRPIERREEHGGEREVVLRRRRAEDDLRRRQHERHDEPRQHAARERQSRQLERCREHDAEAEQVWELHPRVRPREQRHVEHLELARVDADDLAEVLRRPRLQRAVLDVARHHREVVGEHVPDVHGRDECEECEPREHEGGAPEHEPSDEREVRIGRGRIRRSGWGTMLSLPEQEEASSGEGENVDREESGGRERAGERERLRQHDLEREEERVGDEHRRCIAAPPDEQHEEDEHAAPQDRGGERGGDLRH
jgi:hypothetical protein